MNYVHRDLDQVELIDPDHAASIILADIGDSCQILFLNYGEYWPTESVNLRIDSIHRLVSCIKNARKDLKIFFLVDSWWQRYNSQFAAMQFDDILYIDYFVYRIHKELFEHRRSPVAYRWNSQSNRFLFLTGFPYRFNRIRLLKKLDALGLMPYAEWSLYVNDNDLVTKARLHQLVPELSTVELEEFISKYRRNPDQIKLRSADGGYSGLPYDVTLYTKTGFSVIAESLYDAKYHPWCTEKTWKAIANHHPFIIAGVPGTLDFLNRQGIVTFEQFLSVKHYDQITDPEERLNAVASNINWWQKNIHNYSKEINDCVIHNRKVFTELYDINDKRVQQFCIRNNFEHLAGELISTEDRRPDVYPSSQVESDMHSDRIFVNFYNSIKDPNWPAVSKESDFENLPEFIQKECEDVFGYVRLTK